MAFKPYLFQDLYYGGKSGGDCFILKAAVADTELLIWGFSLKKPS